MKKRKMTVPEWMTVLFILIGLVIGLRNRDIK